MTGATFVKGVSLYGAKVTGNVAINGAPSGPLVPANSVRGSNFSPLGSMRRMTSLFESAM